MNLIQTYLNADNELFFTYRSLSENQLLPVSYRTDEEVKKLRAEYEKNNFIQRSFLKYLGQCGIMDGIFAKSVVMAALKNGARPKNYQVHHIVPLCCGGNNSFENLMLVHKDVHREIHDRIWTDIYKALRKNKFQAAYVDIPELPIVMTPRDRMYLLDMDEIRQLIVSEKSKRFKKAYQNSTQICVRRGECSNRLSSYMQTYQRR